MRADVRRALRGLALPTIALLGVAAFLPGRLEPAVRAYSLLVCAVALAVAVGALRRAYPPSEPLRRAARKERARPRPPRELAELENLIALGAGDAGDLHFRLRPRLRSIAASLLESRRGVSLERQPDASRALLGDETWELVRPDRPPPDDERAHGASAAALDRAVLSMERL